MKNHFFLIYLIPIAILAISEICFFWHWHGIFYVGLAFSIILIFLSVKAITREKFFSFNFFWLSFLPSFFLASSSAYALIIPETYLVQIIFFSQFLFIFYFLKNLTGEIKKSFLENISSWGSFLSLFFFFSFLLGVKTFIGFSAVYTTAFLIIGILLVVAENFWANNIARSDSLFFLFLITMILIQLVWALYFLPLNHNIKGITLAICYYVIMGITKPFLRGGLSDRIIKFYLIGGLISIVILFAAAKWI